MTDCRCSETPVLWTGEAGAYAGAHLVCDEVREDGTAVLRCPVTGRRWLQDAPADERGVSALRLRWLELGAADVVEYLSKASASDDVLLMMDPDVEHQPLPGEDVLHGLGELRAYTARHLGSPHPPRSAAISVHDCGDSALVLGHVSHNRDGRYVEHRPAAWLVTVRDGRVVRVRAFADWVTARREAGLPEDAGRGRRIGPVLRFLRARPLRLAYRL